LIIAGIAVLGIVALVVILVIGLSQHKQAEHRQSP